MVRPRTVDIDPGFINIPSKVGQKAWESCWRKTATRASIFGVCENFTRKQRGTYRAQAKRHNYGVFGLSSPNPIFWDRSLYKKLSGRVITLHAGAKDSWARRFPGFNAERKMSELILADWSGQEYAVLCSHWVPEQNVSLAFKLSARRASKKKTRELIRYHRSLGRIVIFMADTNIYRRINLAGMIWMRKRGIDKIGVAVPGNMHVTDAESETFPAPTDHKRGVAGSATIVIG